MKKGISLVALVITIIVLIILTAAVILSFQDGGIIDRADQAVEDSNDAVLEEKITMMNLEYTQKLKKKFTPKTRETLKAIVKQSGIDLDKLLVYYDGADGEQHVFYKIDKVTKSEVEWFLENPVEIEGETEPKKIWWLIGDVDLDGELTHEDADKIQAFGNHDYERVPELPLDNPDYCCMIADINSDGAIDSEDVDTLELSYTTKIKNTISNLSVKEGYIKAYFGIE